MIENLKIILTTIFCCVLVGCSLQNQEVRKEINDVEKINILIEKKLEEVESIEHLDTAVILVNGYAITKKDFEIEKKHSNNDEELKKRIMNEVREAVVLSEATRLGIEPKKEELLTYLERTKKELTEEENSKMVNEYLDKMGFTKESYFEFLDEQEYKNFQRIAWWESVKPQEQILLEAKRKKADVDDISAEYYEKYVDELLKKAEII